MTTIDNSTVWNKGFTEGEVQKPIIKKLHQVSNKTVVIIDDAIINRIGIDKENLWVQEEISDDGILLKICNKKVNRGDPSR